MANLLISLVSGGGLIAIFFLMAGESAGLPISSEIVVPLGGALASGAVAHTAHLDFTLVVAAASVGNLFGSLVAYLLVRQYGERIILGPGRKIGLSRGHMVLAERFFDRFGLFAVFLGRLLPVIRTYISFPAGLSRKVKPIPFTIATILGAVPWNFALAYAGLKLGDHYHDIERNFGKLSYLFIVIVILLVVAIYIFGKRMHVEDKVMEAEDEVAEDFSRKH
ncbi:MAG TPA: DedA family protein [Candidatus Dormibacteraeota bacterium]|nr:DedA family protein [Candidatus Dormibacteraeota bacterium]